MRAQQQSNCQLIFMNLIESNKINNLDKKQNVMRFLFVYFMKMFK